MPRKPDPDLEARILKAAQMLWRRGGEKALTMRAVANAAKTNTPAVYRRFKDRKDIVVALLRQYQVDLGTHFESAASIEETAEVYIDYLLTHPHAFELLVAHGAQLGGAKKPSRRQPIRASRPNFGIVEDRLAKRLGGSPADHTRLALALWAVGHGAASLLLSRTIPEGHEQELRTAVRAAVKALVDGAAKSSILR